jgi:hypothetical protein
MIIIGGLLGVLLGALLAGGLLAVSGLPVFGPATVVVAAILAAGPAGAVSSVVAPIITLFAAGLGLLVATIFVYAGSAVSLLGVAPPPSPAPPALPAPLGELFGRGLLIGMASSVNFLVMSAIPALSLVAGPVFIVTLLALIPPVAASRFVYQPLLGLVGWILPLNYLMLPIGILLFLVNAPFAIAAGGIGAIRLDFLTATIETRGGALLAALFAAAPAPGSAFNVGNFTFLAPATTPTAFGATGVSAHETGHTLSSAAFGGFFYWIGAVDQNIPPLGRGAAAYSELLAESHFSGLIRRFLPMW